MSSVFENKVVVDIVSRYKRIWALEHAISLLGWDQSTYMPVKGVSERASARAEIFVLRRSLLLDPGFVNLVEKATTLEGLNDYEKGVVRVLYREIERLTKIPEKLTYELAKTSSEAEKAWEEAKKRDDYSLFKPYLAKLVELTRQVAEHIGYEEHPYNALLDRYEEGLTIRDVDMVFDAIIPALKRILDRVLSEGRFPREHELEKVAYDTSAMDRANRRILDLLEYPWDRARLDVSAHPFTTNMGIDDVRITTRYEGTDPKKTVYSVIHEYGHALYELQIDRRLSQTPIASGAGLGVHESQSRFWENVVGRSREFVALIKPVLEEAVPEIKNYSVDELYRYVNTVRPSLIRVDADELTYNFHIYLRYKIEKMLVTGELNVDDIPEVWNDTIEELLGVRPRGYKDGVLQDIHWSIGSIGYFPTYTIGTVLAAQIKYALERDNGPLSSLIADRRFDTIRSWLGEKIHQWGSTYPPKTLVVKALGEPLNPQYYIRYLEEKYLG